MEDYFWQRIAKVFLFFIVETKQIHSIQQNIRLRMYVKTLERYSQM